MHRTRNAAYGQPYRGFESLPLRQTRDRGMIARRPAFKSSPTNPALGEIQTLPARKPDMPYAPAIRVSAPGDLLFISGATPSPLYHKHPHVLSEHNHPVGIEAQTRLAIDRNSTRLSSSHGY